MNMKQFVMTVVTTTAIATALPSFADRHRDDDGYSRGKQHREVVKEKKVRKNDRSFARYLDQRQSHQLRRIAHGIDNGELTRKEVRKLKRRQQRIARVDRKFLTDGQYSRKERRILEAKLDKASEKIALKKHNDRVRQQRYASGLWKPRHGSDDGFRKGRRIELTAYPGQGFAFWW